MTITCNATDAIYMQFSNNGSTWSPGKPTAPPRQAGASSADAGGSPPTGHATVYARFSDGAGGTADLGNKTTTSTNVILDTTGPSGTLSINSGAAWTRTGTVTLSITGSDANYASSTFQMQFSNDGSTWSTWEAFATSKSWNMTSGYGGTTTNTASKYVYVQLKDPLGNSGHRSTPPMTTIGYDTAAPTIASVSLNGGAAYTNSATVTITLSATDAAPSSGLYQMRFSNNASSGAPGRPTRPPSPGT